MMKNNTQCNEIARAKLQDIIDLVQQLEESLEASYMMYAVIEDNGLLETETVCSVMLISNYASEEEIFEIIPRECFDSKFEPVYEIDLMQNVIRAAKSFKAEPTVEEIIRSLNYFANYDTYLDLNNE